MFHKNIWIEMEIDEWISSIHLPTRAVLTQKGMFTPMSLPPTTV